MSTLTPFCTDVDLLQWEPNLLRDATFASQTLLSGTGELVGTTFSISSGSFTDASVSKDHVIVLGGEGASCLPIVSIDADQSLTVSVFTEPAGDDPAPPLPPSLSGTLAFSIRTFWPQRAIVSEILAQAAGLNSSRAGEAAPAILNPQALRRPCVLGTLQLIYSALAAASPDDPHFDVRAQLYERLYRRALRNAAVDIDLNDDGRVDAHRLLSVLNFRSV